MLSGWDGEQQCRVQTASQRAARHNLFQYAQLDRMQRAQNRTEAHLQDWPAISGSWSCSAVPSAAMTSLLLGSFCLQSRRARQAVRGRQIQINRQVG